MRLREHARQLARGTVPAPTFRAVTAFADHLRFQALPHAGGTFDQPASLLEDMRVVAAAYHEEADRREDRASRRAGKKGRK